MARGMQEGPVQFPWSQAILAGATFNPLDNWDYETPGTDVAVEILHRATAVGLVAVAKTGGLAIQQEGPVPAGGTAGQPPGRISLDPITGRGFGGQKLSLFYRNPTGGTITVDGLIISTPIGGGGRRGPPRKKGKK